MATSIASPSWANDSCCCWETPPMRTLTPSGRSSAAMPALICAGGGAEVGGLRGRGERGGARPVDPGDTGRGVDHGDVGDGLQPHRLGGRLAGVLAGVGDRLLLGLGLEGLGATLGQPLQLLVDSRHAGLGRGDARRQLRHLILRRDARDLLGELEDAAARRRQSGSAGRSATFAGIAPAAPAGFELLLGLLQLASPASCRPSARSPGSSSARAPGRCRRWSGGRLRVGLQLLRIAR